MKNDDFTVSSDDGYMKIRSENLFRKIKIFLILIEFIISLRITIWNNVS